MTKAAIKTGFFTMETVNEVLAMQSLEEAKQYTFNIVREAAKARSTNVDKANSMINKATSVKKLAMDIANFVLAHPSENLKTIR